MQLEGKTINHIKFGEGIVKDLSENYITVIFTVGEKKFVYPNAFQKYLEVQDLKIQSQITNSIKLLQKEETVAPIQVVEPKKTKKLRNKKEIKTHSDSQTAFGFVQNKTEEVFSNWSVYAGSYQSGGSKGKPKLPIRLKLSSACLLTECRAGEAEHQRRIIGLFMPREDFEGASCKDGMINSHDKYRIRLDDNENMLFWNYIPTSERSSKWGNIELRYLSDATMQKIISDMQQVIKDDKKNKVVRGIYEYFCKVNGLKEASNN